MFLHKAVKWDIIDHCNLRCKHCSVAGRYFENPNKPKSVSTADRMRIAQTLAEARVKHVSILGGEPFLLGDELFDIIGLLKSHGVSISLVTNGLLIDAKTIDRIIKVHPDRMVFSIEGPDAEFHDHIRGKGNFDKLTAVIQELNSATALSGKAISFNINTVVTRLNRASIPRMIPLARELGIHELSLLGLNCVGNAAKNLDQLLLSVSDELDLSREIADVFASKDYRNELKLNLNFIYPLMRDYLLVYENRYLPFPQICCNAASTLAFINPWGDMHPCDRIYMGNHQNRFNGHNGRERSQSNQNLIHDDFHKIWNSAYFLNTFDIVSNEAAYESYMPCGRCAYFHKKKCNPCPLDAMGLNQFPVESCLYIERQLSSGIDSLIQQALDIDAMKSQPASTLVGEESLASLAHLTDIPLNRNALVRAIHGVRVAYLRGEQKYLLIHPFSGESLFLDHKAYKLWALLKEHPQSIHKLGEHYLNEIFANMCVRPSISIKSKCQGNIEMFIATLLEKSFIESALSQQV